MALDIRLTRYFEQIYQDSTQKGKVLVFDSAIKPISHTESANRKARQDVSRIDSTMVEMMFGTIPLATDGTTTKIGRAHV